MTRSWDKIRQKHAPTAYKRGPGLTGAARLQRRVQGLVLAAARLERKQDADQAYASALRAALQAFIVDVLIVGQTRTD